LRFLAYTFLKKLYCKGRITQFVIEGFLHFQKSRL
jgi:hypothetical protein